MQASASSSNDDWPMFCHDAAHTGATTSRGPTNLTELWSFKEEAADTHFSSPSSPAVVNDIAYFCSNWDGKTDYGGKIYAFNAHTGAKIWSVSIDNDHISSSPAVSENRLFVGVLNDVIAIDALSGARIWNYTTGGTVLSPVVVGNIVYVSSYADDIYALNASTGAKIWNYTTEKMGGNFGGSYGVICPPAVANGIVYVGSGNNGNLYAFDALNGTVIWQTEVGCYSSSPSVSGGMVYIGSWAGYVYALNALTGAKVWSFKTWHFDAEIGVVATPVVANGIVYIGSQGIASFYAINASTGKEIWNGRISMVQISATVADGIVYLGTGSYNASTGASMGNFYVNGESYLTSAVVDGILYAASSNGTFYALGEPSANELAFFGQTLLIVLVTSIVTAVILIFVFLTRKRKRPNTL